MQLLWVGGGPLGELQLAAAPASKATDLANPTTSAATRFQIQHSETLQEAVSFLKHQPIDVVVTRLSFPDTFGFDSVIALHAAAHNTPIVVIATAEDEQFALQALTLGAQEYLVEGSFRARDLRVAILRALERKALEHRLEQLTQVDTQTGLRNRALLRDRFGHLLLRARREEQPFVFAVIRIENQQEDARDCDVLMRSLSEKLAACARASDTLARLTYNSFGLLLEHLDPVNRGSVLNRLVDPLRPLCPHRVTLRIACASFPEDGDTVDGLLNTAQSRL